MQCSHVHRGDLRKATLAMRIISYLGRGRSVALMSPRWFPAISWQSIIVGLGRRFDPPVAMLDDRLGYAETVLEVDEEEHIRGLYESTLSEIYQALFASMAGEALDRLSPAVDVILLDRRMSEMSIDKLLDVTSLAFDVDMVKPVRRAELYDLVKKLCARNACGLKVRELYSLTEKIRTLETIHERLQLLDDRRYQQLIPSAQPLEESTSDRISCFVEQGDSEVTYPDVLA